MTEAFNPGDWEGRLGPELTGLGKPMDRLTDPELDARIVAVESHLLDVELDELASGNMTPDELAEEARKSAEFYGDDPDVI